MTENWLGDQYWHNLAFYQWLRKMGLYETLEIIFSGNSLMANYLGI